MNKKLFAAYFRVSTDGQGLHGLGMDAQRSAVLSYLKGKPPDFVFEEVESGRKSRRPELIRALACCKEHKATLVIAKLDRLSRNAHFLLGLRDSGIDFVACDMPEADRFTVGIMAVCAEREAELTSLRTKAALAQAKRRGTVLGNPRPAYASAQGVAARRDQSLAFAAQLHPVIKDLQSDGVRSLRKLAASLNRRGFTTPTGKQFSAQSVKNALALVG